MTFENFKDWRGRDVDEMDQEEVDEISLLVMSQNTTPKISVSGKLVDLKSLDEQQRSDLIKKTVLIT